ncbi:MAG: DNA alkylation repair protein [Paracoccaceae bacterium]
MIKAALAELEAAGDANYAARALAYHKARRRYLGIPVPAVTELADGWRASLSLADRVTLASDLWRTDIHEARVAAAKLLIQARIRPDDAVWELFQSWVPQFDGWALADHACDVGARRLMADPARLDVIESWTTSPHMWMRRAALVATLPFAKSNNPKPFEEAARDRILGWAASYADDKEWFIQKAIAWWVRDLSKHDALRAAAFLAAHGDRLKPFAAKEVGKYLAP